MSGSDPSRQRTLSAVMRYFLAVSRVALALLITYLIQSNGKTPSSPSKTVVGVN
jgi:hypothetical protein